MSTYTIQEFLQQTAQDPNRNNHFELENPYTLEVNLGGGRSRLKAKVGSMIGYVGQVKFKREGILEGGLGKALLKQVTGEGQKLMNIEGQGRVYFADHGKRVQILQLQGEAIFVNGNDLLALEDGLDYNIKLMRRVAGMMAGGLFNILIRGEGLVAITTHYTPITLRVTPEQPVRTDPNATVAWSGNLTPDVKTDMSIGTFFGRSSGETFQLEFRGDGWVVLQPYEEVYFQAES
jgi:uncharacterized protein (AIM24 family)